MWHCRNEENGSAKTGPLSKNRTNKTKNRIASCEIDLNDDEKEGKNCANSDPAAHFLLLSHSCDASASTLYSVTLAHKMKLTIFRMVDVFVAIQINWPWFLWISSNVWHSAKCTGQKKGKGDESERPGKHMSSELLSIVKNVSSLISFRGLVSFSSSND